MSSLARMYPSLTTFSDLDWDLVTAEYETNYHDLSFPEYLQQKAAEGDCPTFLFELAYFELAQFEVKALEAKFPHEKGLHLNPTALFLSLDYDVVGMLEEAKNGQVGVIEMPHCLCVYKDRNNNLKTAALEEDDLIILQQLENGPASDRQKLSGNVSDLVKAEIIFDLT